MNGKLYQSIWWEEGSPLMVVSRRQQAGLSAALQEAGIDMPVALGMSYGEPSMATAWQELKDQGVDRVILLPMYPQYSVSTTASVFDSWARLMKSERRLPAFRFIHDYHDSHGYIQALAESVREHWEDKGRTDLLLLSYHGIPKRFEDEGDPYGTSVPMLLSQNGAGVGVTPGTYGAYSEYFLLDEALCFAVSPEQFTLEL